MLAALGVLAIGCNKDNKSSSSSGGNPLTAPVDYLGATVNAQKRSTVKIDLISLNQAVQLFNAQEGRNPKDLEELVSSHYMGQLPTPPPGMKLSYDSNAGKVTMVASGPTSAQQ